MSKDGPSTEWYERRDRVAKELHKLDIEHNNDVISWESMSPEYHAMYRQDAERLLEAADADD